MPIVTLTVSKTIAGSDAADALSGGGSGLDLGTAESSSYTPVISKAANTGWQALYIRHGGVNSITGVKTFIQPYAQTYGGDGGSAANDFATLSSYGAASSNSANNGDGAGGGLRIEHDADLPGTLGASAFDGTRAQVKIYGKAGNGVSLSTAYDVHVDAMVYNNAGTPVDATTPVTGEIGASGDTVKGDRALVKLRYYLPSSPSAGGGIIQGDWVIAFSYTSALLAAFAPSISRFLSAVYGIT